MPHQGQIAAPVGPPDGTDQFLSPGLGNAAEVTCTPKPIQHPSASRRAPPRPPPSRITLRETRRSSFKDRRQVSERLNPEDTEAIYSAASSPYSWFPRSPNDIKRRVGVRRDLQRAHHARGMNDGTSCSRRGVEASRTARCAHRRFSARPQSQRILFLLLLYQDDVFHVPA